MAKKRIPHVTVYDSYRFLPEEKDPIIDAMRTIVEREGQSYQKIHEHGGPAVGTMSQWFTGSTRRPQFVTVAAFARALGYDVQITKRRGKLDYDGRPFIPVSFGKGDNRGMRIKSQNRNSKKERTDVQIGRGMLGAGY